MPMLEFIDCPRCGKRVSITAKSCHHCQRLQNRTGRDQVDDDAESHHASSIGGYDASQDDFDYGEFLADEFPDHEPRSIDRNRWKYVSILLLIVFVFLFLVQLL